MITVTLLGHWNINANGLFVTNIYKPTSIVTIPLIKIPAILNHRHKWDCGIATEPKLRVTLASPRLEESLRAHPRYSACTVHNGTSARALYGILYYGIYVTRGRRPHGGIAR